MEMKISFLKNSHRHWHQSLNSSLSTKFKSLLAIFASGPNLDEKCLKLSISSFWKNLTKINAKKYTIIHAKIPGNNHKVVLGIINANIPIINDAIIILIIDIVGALVLVSLNTKYTHGIIISIHAMLVANAPPAIPIVGTITQLRMAVTTAPPTRIYIGILGLPIPWIILVDIANIE